MKLVFTFLVFFLGFSLISQGQITKLTLGFDKDTIEIGSQVEMTLSVKMESGGSIVAISGNFLDSIYSTFQTVNNSLGDTSSVRPALADFDVIDMGGWKDRNQDGVFSPDEMIWQKSQLASSSLMQHTFVLRFWDPGDIIVILPQAIHEWKDNVESYSENGFAKLFIAPPDDIKNISMDSLDMAPIKPILQEPRNFDDFLPYVLGLSLIIALFIFFIWRKKRKVMSTLTDDPEIKEDFPAGKEALEKLYRLRSEKLWQVGKIKEYQSRLTYIIREYLENRFRVAALESTTDEIVKSLKNQSLTKEQVGSLVEILRVADLVKFAKAKPKSNIHEEFMDKATHFVHETDITLNVIPD